MKLLNFSLIIIFFLMFLYVQQENTNINSININNNLSIFYNNTFSIMGDFEYTNLYKEEFTYNKFIINFINPILYTIIAEINNFIPLIIHLSFSKTSEKIFIFIIIYLLIIILINIPNILKNIIAIYFFIKEKKKYKEKWYE